MNLYVGTSGYSYKEWKGSFYPRDLPATRMLRYYGERFRAVEINSSFYRLPTTEMLSSWAADVPADFSFALKAPRQITHTLRLKDAGSALASLLAVAGVLGDRLGPLLFQLPPNFKRDLPRLQTFLALLPPQVRAAFEFRHASWFEQEVYALLRQHRAVLCIAEADGELAVPLVATGSWGYLRLRRSDYGDAELADWVERVRRPGWRDVFVFFKHEAEGKGPQLARRFLELAA